MENENKNIIYRANKSIRNASIGLIVNGGVAGWCVALASDDIIQHGRYGLALFHAAIAVLPAVWTRNSYKRLCANKEVLAGLAEQNAGGLETKVDGQ